jgi:hypothetical protein
MALVAYAALGATVVETVNRMALVVCAAIDC